MTGESYEGARPRLSRGSFSRITNDLRTRLPIEDGPLPDELATLVRKLPQGEGAALAPVHAERDRVRDAVPVWRRAAASLAFWVRPRRHSA